MNPPFILQSLSSLPFLPLNPNPNPNSSPTISSFVPSTTLPIDSSIFDSNPAPSDLTANLSKLKLLINVTETILNSLPPIFFHPTSSHLSICPFNPHHRVPPESLFLHFLHCHSSPNRVIDPSLLDTLQYPKTLKREDELKAPNPFVQNQSDSELCFALDGCANLASNFYYRSCPGVFSSLDHDGDARKTFTLPVALLAECSNFVGEPMSIPIIFRRLLPSELWTVRGEVESWIDYPYAYSYYILQLLSQLPIIKESDSLRFVISNSATYGIVIDKYMKNHILLLFRFCLKAIIREAIGMTEILKNGELKGKNIELIMKAMTFKCPILVEVLTWFASQLSVLYGEINAKPFVINQFRQCLLNAQSELLLVFSGNGLKAINESLENSKENDGVIIMGMGLSAYRMEFSVSQIAAAIAALHERSHLEKKIRGLQFSGFPTNYHRMVETTHFSRLAHEERKNRYNYRPIIEHDGLHWHRSTNQETGKSKTREELLAEERDYKRRRMSYRGKKLKRTTLQVMRDIIDDYMNEIKQAGGIGCSVKGAEKVGALSCETKSQPQSKYDAKQGFEKDDFDNPTQNSYPHDESRESRDRKTRFSKTPDRKTSIRCSQHHHVSKSFLSKSYYSKDSDMGKDSDDMKISHGRGRYGSTSSSVSVIRSRVDDDRYDPSKSRDMYEDDDASV